MNTQVPVAFCDKCGNPIHHGNRPDGRPNGVTFIDCNGIPGNNITVCADCLFELGKRRREGAAPWQMNR